MSDNFSANAELGFDVNDFLSSGKQVEDILERLEDVALIFSEAVEKNIAVLNKMGDTAKKAATEAKSSNDKLVSDERDAYRLRKMYEEEFRRSQRDGLRLQAMYEREARQKMDRAHAEAIKENLRRERAAQAERRKIISDGKMLDAAYKQNAAFDARKQNQEQANLSRARYALYDVSTVFTAVSAAALGTVGAINAVGVAFEKDFASVARTSGLSVQSDIDNLRESLVDLSTNIPVDFASITAIGTLAGQLGVAAEDIADFTEVVAMFSASTNVSVEKSAEDIGRVAQLTGVAGDQYENLASSIYQVGVTSVATESAILETATNISTAGNLAGFSADQIVALSGAFASLGVAPERARGSVQRIFGELTDAVSSGGEQLTAFANLSGMTASDFAATWKGDPQTAFNAFVQGLGAAHAAGQDTNAMLKDLGINAVRDIQALQVLANNFTVYADAQREAGSAFVAGTALAEGYAITAETTAAKIQVLANTFKALFDAASNSDALGFAVEVLTDIVKVTDALISNPVGKFFVTMAGSIAVAVGVYALYNAAVARATASAYANRTAMETMRNSEVNVQRGLRGMVSEMVKMTQVLKGLDLSANKTAVGLERVGASAQASAAQVAASTKTMQGATAANAAAAASSGAVSAGLTGIGNAARVAGAGLMALARFFAPAAAISGVIWGISKAWEGYTRATETAGDRAKRVFGDLSDLATAVQKDTEEWEKHNAQVAAGEKVTNEAAGSYKTMTVTVEETERALTDASKAVSDSLGVTVQMSDANSEVTKTFEKQTVALGDNAAAFLYNKYATGENFDTLVEFQQKLNQFDLPELNGFDFGEMIRASLDPESGGAEAYLDQFISRVGAKLDEYNRLMDQATLDKNDLGFYEAQNAAAEYVKLNDVLQGLRGTTKDSDSAIASLASQFPVASSLASAFKESIGGVADEAESAGEEVETFAKSFESLTSALSATAAVEDSLYNLGKSVAENGVYFDIYSEQGRANFEALGNTISAMSEQAGSDTQMFANNLVLMLDQLQSVGVDTGNELGYVYEMLASLVSLPGEMSFDSSAARADIRAFIESAIAALEARAQLEREGAKNAVGISPSASAEQWKAYNDQIANAGKVADEQAAALRNLLSQLDAQQKQTQRTGSATQGYRDAVDRARAANDKATKAAKDNTKATKDQAKAVRTYADYASDLAAVLDRSFELQFGNQQAADDVLDARDAVDAVFKAQNDYIQEQRDLITESKQAILEYDASINKLKADIQGMKASNKILEYQLGIARKYGNALAEQSILAEIAANNAKIGENEAEITGITLDKAKAERTAEQAAKDLTQALADLKSGLEGNSKFSRDLRDAMFELIGAQNAELVQMAKNGASQDELKRKAREHRTAVRELGNQYGISRGAIQPFIAAVNNSIRTINKVPSDVTVTLKYKKDGSVKKVATAYAELKAKTVEATAKGKKDPSLDSTKRAYDALKNKKVTVNVGANTKELAKAARAEKIKASIARARYDYETRLASNELHAAAGYKAYIDRMTAVLASGNFWSGGFTGRGGKYEPAGAVHKGEFVIPKQFVNQSTGTPDISALGFMFKSMSMPAKSTTSNRGGSGVQLVEILPNQLARLEAAAKVLVNLDLDSLANGINMFNQQNNVRGSA